ncbi:unnamed protein product [Camellia sinensis]
MGNEYTKNIFEEFQDEYFLSIESDIQAIEYANGCSLYTIVNAIGKNARKVKMEMNGSLACSCSKFERKTSKGKRRIKGPCELALQGSFKKKFRAKCANNLAYYAQPTFITLLQAGYDIGFEDSEALNTDFRLTNNLLLCTKVLLLLFWYCFC